MPGVTEQEIAQAKQMNLYQYMQLCEPDNFKPEGPGQFRHKGHSSLTFAEDGSWTYFKTKATGRTALNYLIAVEGVSFVEAVREINRIQGGVRPSFQPVKEPLPRRNRQRNSGCQSQIRTTTLLLPIFASAAFTPMC